MRTSRGAAATDRHRVSTGRARRSGWCTPPDTEPVWLAGKRAALERDVHAYVRQWTRRAGDSERDLAAAEAAGAVFRGGREPYEWAMPAATAFEPVAAVSPPPTLAPFPPDVARPLFYSSQLIFVQAVFAAVAAASGSCAHTTLYARAHAHRLQQHGW